MKQTIVLLLSLLTCSVHAQQLQIQDDARTVQLDNQLIKVSFNKTNADITAIYNQAGKSLLGKQGRGYLLGPGFSMSPATYQLVRKTDELIEIAFDHTGDNHFRYQLHYIIKKGVSGIYCFLVQSHKAGDSTGHFGQTRWGIRADEENFDYHLVRDSIQGPMPKMAELKKENEIQDWTFRMPDSSVYTKYNYADYIADRHVHGMAGQKSGLGLFVIQASHEYLNGGPTKQYQNVHSNPYLICMFNCGHFLSDIRKGDDKISDEWVKLNGPFLLYINQGESIPAIWENAKQQAAKEISLWPYAWMQHPEYVQERGLVTGNLLLNGKSVQEGTRLVLAPAGTDWQAHSRGYIYTGTTDRQSQFSIPHIRPGIYTLYAYGSDQTDEYKQEGVVIKSGSNALGQIDWQPPVYGKKIWQIGIADRRTTGFKFANHARTYGLFNNVPADLNFIVGKSIDSVHWYYAQTKRGRWDISFSLNYIQGKTASLTIAMAGAARQPQLEIFVNGTNIGTLDKLGNDASVYRSAIAGGYYQQHVLTFPVSYLKKGNNVISLSLVKVKPGGGIMYDAVKLEIQ